MSLLFSNIKSWSLLLPLKFLSDWFSKLEFLELEILVINFELDLTSTSLYSVWIIWSRSVSIIGLGGTDEVNNQFCEKFISSHFKILLVAIFDDSKFVSTKVVFPALVIYLALRANVLRTL